MNYAPNYLKNIQNELASIITFAENAAEKIEESHEYNNQLHPFHAASVAAYNRLTTVLLSIEPMLLAEEA